MPGSRTGLSCTNVAVVAICVGVTSPCRLMHAVLLHAGVQGEYVGVVTILDRRTTAFNIGFRLVAHVVHAGANRTDVFVLALGVSVATACRDRIVRPITARITNAPVQGTDISVVAVTV